MTPEEKLLILESIIRLYQRIEVKTQKDEQVINKLKRLLEDKE